MILEKSPARREVWPNPWRAVVSDRVTMKTIQVRVPWAEGLHMRPAACVARVACRFHSEVRLRLGERVAEAGSLLSLVVLCASLNALIDIEADGDDEQEAVRAVATCFEAPSPDTTGAG